MSRNEHNVGVRSLATLAYQVEPVDIRELNVQKEASGYVGLRVCVVLRSGTKRDDVQVVSRQQVGQRFADPPVIVHDKNDMVLAGHSREDAPLARRSPSTLARPAWDSALASVGMRQR